MFRQIAQNVDPNSLAWHDHYRQIVQMGDAWLDGSNAATQNQTYASVIEAAGEIAGRSCVDLGCGTGGLSGMLVSLGAGSVLGIDFMAELVMSNQSRIPGASFALANLNDASSVRQLGLFDRVFLVESLQCVGGIQRLPHFWSLVAPGGSLIAAVPNHECPLFDAAADRFKARTGLRPVGASPIEVQEAASALPGLEAFYCRLMCFQEDQSLVPYRLSDWVRQAPVSAPYANRIVFVARRHSSPQLVD